MKDLTQDYLKIFQHNIKNRKQKIIKIYENILLNLKIPRKKICCESCLTYLNISNTNKVEFPFTICVQCFNDLNIEPNYSISLAFIFYIKYMEIHSIKCLKSKHKIFLEMLKKKYKNLKNNELQIINNIKKMIKKYILKIYFYQKIEIYLDVLYEQYQSLYVKYLKTLKDRDFNECMTIKDSLLQIINEIESVNLKKN
ncbi:hypothetical protein CWI36_0437p0030 [Hamiltosporidium magnivora]|uniref:Uncharacterized protein n=1 Tax=Hamiltosporidium magnivora TaxID=148818 RepID=A0A4Q9LGF5_9MICR|nr:hypothetical protein CWI36_0437p0030 [Hamiltosporidium magnivora]